LPHAKCIVSTYSLWESIAPEFLCENSGDQIRPNKGKEVIGVKGGKETLAMRLSFIIHAKEVKDG
jgi:hypothetical protein